MGFILKGKRKVWYTCLQKEVVNGPVKQTFYFPFGTDENHFLTKHSSENIYAWELKIAILQKLKMYLSFI
jgi:hypothetical protein